jgi:hypothetical protein
MPKPTNKKMRMMVKSWLRKSIKRSKRLLINTKKKLQSIKLKKNKKD